MWLDEMDDAVAQHDILDVISSSNRLSSFIMKRIAVASFFAALRGCVRPSASDGLGCYTFWVTQSTTRTK